MDVPPDGPEPPKFAAYPRHLIFSEGSADKLQALADGYYGLNAAFLVNLVLMALLLVVSGLAPSDLSLAITTAGAIAIGAVVGAIAHRSNKRIAYGAEWKPSSALTASIFIGLSAALCCGLPGYILIQSLATAQIKRYGVPSGFFGFKRRDVQAVIESMRANPGSTPVMT